MIQKRYEYWTAKGKLWTDWFNYCDDNGQLETLRQEEQWQIKNKLRNEFRVVNK